MTSAPLHKYFDTMGGTTTVGRIFNNSPGRMDNRAKEGRITLSTSINRTWVNLVYGQRRASSSVLDGERE
jgi:hypothetical protein